MKRGLKHNGIEQLFYISWSVRIIASMKRGLKPIVSNSCWAATMSGQNNCLNEERIETRYVKTLSVFVTAGQNNCLNEERIETWAVKDNHIVGRWLVRIIASMKRGLKLDNDGFFDIHYIFVRIIASMKRGLKLSDVTAMSHSCWMGQNNCLNEERIET